MKLELSDVIDFIGNASTSELNSIGDKIQEEGYEFECEECETHECEECNCEDEICDSKIELLQSLAIRLDQFGLEDMLDELKKEFYQHGINTGGLK